MGTPYQMPGCIYIFVDDDWTDIHFTLSSAGMLFYIHYLSRYMKFDGDCDYLIDYETSSFTDLPGPDGRVTLIIE